MVKIATVRKVENEQQRASDYVKNTVLFPSAMLGLVSIVLGYGALIYLMFKGGFLAGFVVDSTILLVAGIGLGLIQSLYHRYLFDRFPDYFAQKRRRAEQLRARKVRKVETIEKPEHPGRWAVPLFYLAGFSGMIGLIVYYTPRLNAMAAVFLVLAGFYNLRFFFWKRKLGV
jgi:hypothetical protein